MCLLHHQCDISCKVRCDGGQGQSSAEFLNIKGLEILGSIFSNDQCKNLEKRCQSNGSNAA